MSELTEELATGAQETPFRPARLRSLAHHRAEENVLPIEGRLGSFDRARGWLNTEPLNREALRGRVVLVDFWTYTCVNWLRTLPYLRAWHAKYADAGLTIVGVHTPEFPFERELPNVTDRTRALGIDYPVAIDDHYGVWEDFANHYWPAVYLADADGRLRFHHFGEGDYAMTEMAIQHLLLEAGATGLDLDLVTVEPEGLEVAAAWTSLGSPETYLGSVRSSGFVSDDVAAYDRAHHYHTPERLVRNTWALSGDWTVTRDAAVLNAPDGAISFAFHARDVNLIIGPTTPGQSVRFRVTLDGRPVGEAHGTDVDADGRGTVARQDTLQLIRQPGRIEDHTVRVEFVSGGLAAFCFTFG
ncbi:redoxin domain-containing protein [Agromyces aurantiacus]|uniref:Redoxin domain-containing protein n=1 Tax=Agromyces aurantiacus TaxID=165814 RepID=A0ABV9RA22_9MICO|nr:redoxin domain-containing protein [Agromyces aurantiacus]MBM7503687.1 thiol-disulfide isomerase/thioredoxin [Agromyces aurantiacus]